MAQKKGNMKPIARATVRIKRKTLTIPWRIRYLRPVVGELTLCVLSVGEFRVGCCSACIASFLPFCPSILGFPGIINPAPRGRYLNQCQHKDSGKQEPRQRTAIAHVKTSKRRLIEVQ